MEEECITSFSAHQKLDHCLEEMPAFLHASINIAYPEAPPNRQGLKLPVYTFFEQLAVPK